MCDDCDWQQQQQQHENSMYIHYVGNVSWFENVII